jgi:hypothetical protein
MSFHVGTQGLVLCLDAGVSSSYPGSGNTWTDLSGKGNNGTLLNGVGFDDGNGGSLVFDGVDDYAQTTDNGLGTGSSIPHTLEMWVNFNTLTSPRWWLAVIGQYETGSHHWIGTTETQFGAWDANCQRSPTLVGTNNWMHLVGTFDGTTLTYYVNNINTGGSCNADGFNFTNTNFTVGTVGLGLDTEAYFNGKISKISIYNRALTPQEIQQNFNAYRGRFGI